MVIINERMKQLKLRIDDYKDSLKRLDDKKIKGILSKDEWIDLSSMYYEMIRNTEQMIGSEFLKAWNELTKLINKRG